MPGKGPWPLDDTYPVGIRSKLLHSFHRSLGLSQRLCPIPGRGEGSVNGKRSATKCEPCIFCGVSRYLRTPGCGLVAGVYRGLEGVYYIHGGGCVLLQTKLPSFRVWNLGVAGVRDRAPSVTG